MIKATIIKCWSRLNVLRNIQIAWVSTERRAARFLNSLSFAAAGEPTVRWLKQMSRRINLWPIDYEFLSSITGTGDASIKDLLLKQYEANKRSQTLSEWDTAIRIATRVVDHGFPVKNDTPESDYHFLASQMLSLSCQLNRRSPDSEFNWLSFLETIDVCLPRGDSNIYDAFTDGRPWFGATCPFETVYGIIQRNEVPRILEAMSKSRQQFGSDARWMVDPQQAFFEFAAESNSDVWYAA